MNKSFSAILLLTAAMFIVLIGIKASQVVEINIWYYFAIIYFFSFSILQSVFFKKNKNTPNKFIQGYGIITVLKFTFSILFIIFYASIITPDPRFFLWFLVLYLLYTIILGVLFYKKR